jgi:hypothetical protein
VTADPRLADTLEAAAGNGDGTYDGARALSWLSALLMPVTGGLSEQEVREVWEEVKARR